MVNIPSRSSTLDVSFNELNEDFVSKIKDVVYLESEEDSE